jgi:hypothetical protein
LREEPRIRVSGNRVLRKIFRPKRKKVTGNGGNYTMSLMIFTQYFSGDQIENEVGWACSTYGERIDVYMVLVGKPEGKKPLGRPRHKWEDIKMDL